MEVEWRRLRADQLRERANDDAIVVIPVGAWHPVFQMAEERVRIFDFVLMPGDRLSESDLAQQIHVSRTPLRQALQRFQHEGFVKTIPKMGWLIVPLNFEKFDELYDFRILIECFAARDLCATTRTGRSCCHSRVCGACPPPSGCKMR